MAGLQVLQPGDEEDRAEAAILGAVRRSRVRRRRVQEGLGRNTLLQADGIAFAAGSEALRRLRPAEEIALRAIASVVAQVRELLPRFDPFGNDREAEVVGQGDDGA